MCQKLGFKEAIDQSLYLSLPNTMDRKIDNFWVLKRKDAESHSRLGQKNSMRQWGVAEDCCTNSSYVCHECVSPSFRFMSTT